MIIEITTIDNEPDWAFGYFQAFRRWKTERAPDNLPNNYDNWVTLFTDSLRLPSFSIEAIHTEEECNLLGFRFEWSSERDRQVFISNFAMST
jgi:hypothetical protein